ncbi:DHH family phosphoesterase [bacterium]|nr:DHH family phosphoesterase [bacterium]
MQSVKKLIKILKNKNRIFIQTHNYPDHDAVASAFALQYLLRNLKIETKIIYHGDILRDSLQKMNERLKIDILPHYKYKMNGEDSIVLVDSNKKNKNVAELKGNVVAVIDHHPGESFEDLEFCDIRSNYGACATIIFSYFAELKMEPSAEVATALHTAINFDTHQFTRNVSPIDIETVAMLYRVSDVTLVNSLVRNSIKIDDFKYYRYLIDNIRIENNFAYCHFTQGCNKDLLAILADYILSVEEIKFVLLSTQSSEGISFCVRSENPKIPANTAIQTILQGIGSGGGHIDMAGGRIPETKDFNQEKIFKKCLSIAKSGS